MIEKKKPLRWRRCKFERIGAPEVYELHRDGVIYAKVQKHHPRNEGWFTYSMGNGSSFNTAGASMTFDEAKQYAEQCIRDALTQMEPRHDES